MADHGQTSSHKQKAKKIFQNDIYADNAGQMITMSDEVLLGIEAAMQLTCR